MLGLDRDGAFAEALTLPAEQVYPVPEGLSLCHAALAEPVAACLAVLKADLSGGRPLLLGRGRIALLTQRILANRGIQAPIAQGDEAPGRWDPIIEASGTAEGLTQALSMIRPGGLIILKSRPPRPLPLDILQSVRKEVRLQGVHYGDFSEALQLLSHLPVDDLIGEVQPLSSYRELFAAARDGEERKLFFGWP